LSLADLVIVVQLHLLVFQSGREKFNTSAVMKHSVEASVMLHWWYLLLVHDSVKYSSHQWISVL